MRLSWLAASVLVLSGCLEQVGDEPAATSEDCPSDTAFWVAEAGGPLELDGALRTDLLGFFPNTSQARINNMDTPARWKWEVEGIGPADDNTSLVRVGLTPAGAADKPVSINWTTGVLGDCPEQQGVATWRPTMTSGGKQAQPGDGVAVYYAGFWLNGTLFSTNIASVDKSAWPRGGWYTSGDSKPLNVYVYDKDRSEMTAQWSPRNPQTNQPVAWSYSPTIQGFNNAIKGLSTGATRVVVIPPEQAYTQPGRETHALYGDALVFIIDVVEIVDVPCPPEVPNRSACRLPA